MTYTSWKVSECRSPADLQVSLNRLAEEGYEVYSLEFLKETVTENRQVYAPVLKTQTVTDKSFVTLHAPNITNLITSTSTTGRWIVIAVRYET